MSVKCREGQTFKRPKLEFERTILQLDTEEEKEEVILSSYNLHMYNFSLKLFSTVNDSRLMHGQRRVPRSTRNRGNYTRVCVDTEPKGHWNPTTEIDYL